MRILLFGAIIASIFVVNKMFVPAIVIGIICVLLVEIADLIKKRKEKEQLICYECFHFVKTDSWEKRGAIGFCCRKQTELHKSKACAEFLQKDFLHSL